MFQKSYTNFVKARSPEQYPENCKYRVPVLSGEEARKLYLEEVKDAKSTARPVTSTHKTEEIRIVKKNVCPLVKNKDLYEIVQNNDIEKLKHVLDKYPDKINIIDDYGWSLLMIACQANSVESANELLKRGIDVSVRDKGGNSARSLVIKNKNFALVDILLQYKNINNQPHTTEGRREKKIQEEYTCKICNKIFPDREEHLSSTLHNLSASKGKKIPANYVIPSSNKGYQLMLKGGWDRDSGLGRNGSGKKYPIKTIQKKDRKGLGHDKRKQENKTDDIKSMNRIFFKNKHKKDRQFEINFRREFY